MQREPCSDCGTTEGKWRMKGRCDPCYKKMCYRLDPERYIKKANQWRENNPEKYRAGRREISRRKRAARSEEEKKKVNRTDWERRASHMTPEEREKRRIRSIRYYHEHKHEIQSKATRQVAKGKRRAAEKSTLRTLTTARWLEIIQQHDFACVYCGNRPKKLTQDHIVPISKGGTHTADNVVPACWPCNRRKGTRTMEEFLAEIKDR